MNKKEHSSSPSPSILSHYEQRAKKSMSHDYFLYTCLEEQRTLDSVFKKNLGKIHSYRWPMMPEQRLQSAENSSQQVETEPLLKDLVSWYAKEYQELKDELKDLEQQDATVRPFMLMVFDIQELIQKQTGTKLPKVAGSLSELEKNPVWKSLIDVLDEILPARSQLTQKYLYWIYQEFQEESFDIKTLPPVGRYFKIINKALRSRNRRGSSGSSGSFVQGRRDKQGGQHSFDKKAKNQEQQEGDIRQALKELEKGLIKLSQDSSLKEQRLKPQNSFVRRIQHQKAVSEGFDSSSVGEGESRSVLIRRKKKKS